MNGIRPLPQTSLIIRRIPDIFCHIGGIVRPLIFSALCYNKLMTTLPETTLAAYRRSFAERQSRQLAERERWREEALTAVTTAIPSIAARHPSVAQAYLFGSIIRPGEFRLASDVDVAVVGTTPAAYFAFWRDLEAALPNWVIDLRDITEPSFFSERIQHTGLLLYERTDSPPAS